MIEVEPEIQTARSAVVNNGGTNRPPPGESFARGQPGAVDGHNSATANPATATSTHEHLKIIISGVRHQSGKLSTKALAIVAAIFLIAFRSPAGSLSLEDIFPHFSTKTQIIWKAPTNHLREQFWVYKKLPETFSQAVISNAIVLASLVEKGFPKPSRNRICWDYDACPCGHPCTFAIDPDAGNLSYAFPGFRKGSAEDIPSDDVIARRAWECALLLGIDPKQLSQKGITTNFCQYDLKGRVATNNACGRGIVLARRIDGVDYQGDDLGFSIEFGSHGQIRFFSLTWPKLEPYEKHQTARPEQIIACIRAFKTPSPPKGDEPDYFGRIKNLAKATKFTITKITPYYGDGVFGEAPKENGPTEPTRFVTPFAELEAVAELDNTNINVVLFSPILASEVNRLLKMK